MTFVIYLTAFLLGASVFSFLTLVTYRIPEGKPFIRGRSVCDNCGHVLSPLDMIPVFSWVLLRGKCRYCKSRFSPFSSLCELSGGLFATAAVARFSLSLRAASVFAVICVLFTAAVLSLKMTDLPPLLAAVSAVFGVSYYFAAGNLSWYEPPLAALCLLLPVILFYIIRKEKIKTGRLLLISSCGLFPGIKYSLIALAVAAVPAAVTYLFPKKRADIFTAVLCAVACVFLFI